MYTLIKGLPGSISPSIVTMEDAYDAGFTVATRERPVGTFLVELLSLPVEFSIGYRRGHEDGKEELSSWYSDSASGL